jgi:hypothetical protein
MRWCFRGREIYARAIDVICCVEKLPLNKSIELAFILTEDFCLQALAPLHDHFVPGFDLTLMLWASGLAQTRNSSL